MSSSRGQAGFSNAYRSARAYHSSPQSETYAPGSCANRCANDSIRLGLKGPWQRCGEVRRPVPVHPSQTKIRTTVAPEYRTVRAPRPPGAVNSQRLQFKKDGINSSDIQPGPMKPTPLPLNPTLLEGWKTICESNVGLSAPTLGPFGGPHSGNGDHRNE